MSLSSLSDIFLSQHARLLEITTALPEASLLVERFSGREAVSETFRFEIDCLSTNAYLDLKALIGEEITLRLLQADGSKRSWHGYVTEALLLGADGGLARYRVIMEPWLAFLGQRRDNYLFQDKTVINILTQIFADYPSANWTSQVTQKLRQYSTATQYRETDLAFIQRLLAEEGLSYRFSHDQSASAGDDASHARHQLVIFDRDSELPVAAQPEIRFHRSAASEATDTLQVWQESRSVQPNAVSLAGWDYKTLVATGAEATSALDNGELPRLEIHDASQAYRFEDSTAAQLRTDLLLAAHEAKYRSFTGEGSVRQLAEGTVFTLTQHASHSGDDARFTVLGIDHHGANNLGAQAAALLGSTDIESGSYRNRCTAQPAAVPVVPLPIAKPQARSQTAHVVGLPDAVLTTERDHRIKIQFPWQRGATPNAGGLTETAGAGKTGNAPGNDQSGTWVRVAEWLSGANWGSHFLPRIGSEVLVDFLGADIDRPIIVGQAYNGADLPPFSAGHEAGANHPGVLSGWMSHNFEEGHNQWVLDDSPGQSRTRLATSENAGQLSLGHLIHQAPESASRGAWRGSGFELRSDAWLAVRAGEGILISATARPNGQSTQMDVAETVAQLKAAEETAKALSDAASGQTALPLKANAEQTKFIKTIDPKQDGKFTGSVGGQPAQKAQPGSRELGEPTECFAEPIILNEAPSDIGLASPASTLLYAGGHLHATVQQDLHIASAHTVATTVGAGASWFSHAGGIKSIAAAGSHTIQANTDQMEILADQSVTITSSNDEIHILAKEKIVLQAGQSSVTLEGQNITFACPGTFSVKGSGNAFVGPGNGAAGLESLPTGTTTQQTAPAFTEALCTGQYELFKTDNRPFENYDYEIRSGRTGKVLASGRSNASGQTSMVTTQQSESISVYKSVMRESERITENWQAKLASVASRQS
ncbi:type VI secretion system Vgr family protein [Dechloromonas denitrificans]|uniref:type VI secretion system Vgr family protein n=1 Tax=Dechloromonas denitrificans TaxID=281362 RepID=UPI001CFA7A10|nr:type VI secretion system Vgr family protein [Dechloromonas denitrificans]UCV09534.1 type VI secretion system tip protein VgrG [Dechloromonas denitrificans]